MIAVSYKGKYLNVIVQLIRQISDDSLLRNAKVFVNKRISSN